MFLLWLGSQQRRHIINVKSECVQTSERRGAGLPKHFTPRHCQPAARSAFIVGVVFEFGAQPADCHRGGVLKNRSRTQHFALFAQGIAASCVDHGRSVHRERGAEERQESAVPIDQATSPCAVIPMQARTQPAEMRAVHRRSAAAAQYGAREESKHSANRAEAA